MDQTYKVLLWSGGASIDAAGSIRTAPVNIRICTATVDIAGLLDAAAISASASATWAPINGADPATTASVNVAGALSVAG